MSDEQTSGKPISGTRKLYRLGGSVAVTLPPDWLEQHGYKAGDEVTLIANRDLTVCSRQTEKEVYDQVSKTVKKSVDESLEGQGDSE